MESLGKLAIVTVAFLPLKAWHTWVFLTLWGWFVTPFFGVPVPPFWPTAGVILMAALLFPDARADKNDIGDVIIRAIAQPLVVLGLGYLITLVA